MQDKLITSSADPYTIIVRYDHASDLDKLRAYIKTFRKRSSHSYIPPFILIDIFVNTVCDKDDKHKWLRVVYECTEGNSTLSAVRRFPGSMVVKCNNINEFIALNGGLLNA